MAKPRVLIDLLLAHKKRGFSGIPQDARLLFDGLANSLNLSTAGLLWSDKTNWHGPNPKNLEQQAIFVGHHLGESRAHVLARLVGRFNTKLGNIIEGGLTGRLGSSSLTALKYRPLKEMVWRQIFASTVDPRHRNEILEKEFFLSPLGLLSVSAAAILRLPPLHMNTSSFDFVLFQDARKIRVSANTTKVIRYHDGLPILLSDTFPTPAISSLHYRAVRACSDDSIFVCNSTSALTDLAEISVAAAERAAVIPYFVPRLDADDKSRRDLRDLAMACISPSTLDQSNPERLVERWFAHDGKASCDDSSRQSKPDFILALATIEPRKNYERLIQAWQIMRARTGRDVKLAIIGKPGWNYDAILKVMRPHIRQGTLLHLEGVAQNELHAWYSAATCFAFPSIAEGFGLPPIEAMQCGCPVLVSDVAAHRYSAGNAALFCDPYDPDDIASKLVILTNPECRAQVMQMVQRGYRNADRFTVASVLPQWEEFFSTRAKPSFGTHT